MTHDHLRVLIALPLEPGRVPASTPRTPWQVSSGGFYTDTSRHAQALDAKETKGTRGSAEEVPGTAAKESLALPWLTRWPGGPACQGLSI